MTKTSKLAEQYNQQNWPKSAVGYALFMWLIMEGVHFWKDMPSLFNGQFDPVIPLVWLVGGLLYSYSLHFYYHRRHRKQ
jgi:hypothetical protein